ncbi:MAG: SGNH/GDSL hydrolase family protein [Acutalibacteraceae bacterium]|nr:SGNH/GDSL hydrolase family protein [Acutalibacteraceae bacterium]
MAKIVDKNLEVPGKIDRQDIIWYNALEKPFSVHGAHHNFDRLPENFPILRGFRDNSTGVRVRFVTDSPVVAIRCTLQNRGKPTVLSPSAIGGFDLYKRKDDGSEVFAGAFRPPENSLDIGYEGLIEVSGKNCYTVNLPLWSHTHSLYIGLKVGSVIEEAPSYNYGGKPVVFYGSSITHGASASRPGNTYCAMIAQKLGVDHINLGFSGNAKGEQAIADYIANLDMSVFVLDYHHNAYDLELLKNTHYNFYKTVRDKNPQLPIILVSAPTTQKSQWVTGGVKIIKDTLKRAKKEGDQNVYFVNGSNLFTGEYKESCTSDGCHPNDLGFYKMALGIGKVVKKVLGEY